MSIRSICLLALAVAVSGAFAEKKEAGMEKAVFYRSWGSLVSYLLIAHDVFFVKIRLFEYFYGNRDF